MEVGGKEKDSFQAGADPEIENRADVSPLTLSYILTFTMKHFLSFISHSDVYIERHLND